MSHEKAASLTSSLFARKGRASPASLLISELAEGGGELRDDAVVQDLHERHDGEKLKLSARALNGRAGRRKTKAAEGELPLLAFVEAKLAEEGIPAEEPAAEASKAPAEEPAATSAEEPEPAASLLERGAGALRRSSGPAPSGDAVAADEALPLPEAEVAAVALPEVAPDVEVEATTVSGDDNVTAIEDAPPEDAPAEDAGVEDAPVEDAPVEDAPAASAAEPMADTEKAEGQLSAKAGDAGESEAIVVAPQAQGDTVADAEDLASTEAKDEEAGGLGAAPAGAQQVEADRPVSATLALREATAKHGEPPLAAPLPGEEILPQAVPAPPRVSEQTLPWRSAAVLALGVLLGLGAYVMLSDPPAEPPAAVAVKPLASQSGTKQSETPVGPPAEEAPGAAAALPHPDATPAPAEGVPAAAPPEMPTAEVATAAPQPEPSFDIIRIEPDGQSIIAGRAVPYSEWILLNNGDPIASIKADANGEWVVLPDASLVPGANAFSLVPKAEQGRVAIPAAGEPEVKTPGPEAAPPPAEPDVQSGAPGQAGEQRSDVALPKPKPAVSPPSYAAVESGDYQVQLASVRQSADAERERQRLAAVYPQLLGRLDLQVQEAAVEGAGTFFRVRSGAMADLGSARDVCRRLEAAGQGCLVVRRAAGPEEAQAIEEGNDVAQQETFKLLPPPRQQAQRPE